MDKEELEQSGVSEHTGFPNAATDSRLSALDLSKILVRNPSSTFYMRIEGDSGSDYTIFAEDIVVIDRALTPRSKDLVVWWDDGFMISRTNKLPNDVVPWGVITHVIHNYRDRAS